MTKKKPAPKLTAAILAHRLRNSQKLAEDAMAKWLYAERELKAAHEHLESQLRITATAVEERHKLKIQLEEMTLNRNHIRDGYDQMHQTAKTWHETAQVEKGMREDAMRKWETATKLLRRVIGTWLSGWFLGSALHNEITDFLWPRDTIKDQTNRSMDSSGTHVPAKEPTINREEFMKP